MKYKLKKRYVESKAYPIPKELQIDGRKLSAQILGSQKAKDLNNFQTFVTVGDYYGLTKHKDSKETADSKNWFDMLGGEPGTLGRYNMSQIRNMNDGEMNGNFNLELPILPGALNFSENKVVKNTMKYRLVKIKRTYREGVEDYMRNNAKDAMGFDEKDYYSLHNTLPDFKIQFGKNDDGSPKVTGAVPELHPEVFDKNKPMYDLKSIFGKVGDKYLVPGSKNRAKWDIFDKSREIDGLDTGTGEVNDDMINDTKGFNKYYKWSEEYNRIDLRDMYLESPTTLDMKWAQKDLKDIDNKFILGGLGKYNLSGLNSSSDLRRINDGEDTEDTTDYFYKPRRIPKGSSGLDL